MCFLGLWRVGNWNMMIHELTWGAIRLPSQNISFNLSWEQLRFQHEHPHWIFHEDVSCQEMILEAICMSTHAESKLSCQKQSLPELYRLQERCIHCIAILAIWGQDAWSCPFYRHFIVLSARICTVSYVMTTYHVPKILGFTFMAPMFYTYLYSSSLFKMQLSCHFNLRPGFVIQPRCLNLQQILTHAQSNPHSRCLQPV